MTPKNEKRRAARKDCSAFSLYAQRTRYYKVHASYISAIRGIIGDWRCQSPTNPHILLFSHFDMVRKIRSVQQVNRVNV